MTGREALSLLIGILEQEKLPYMIVGSFSSNYHGIPRSTNDANIVLQFDPANWRSLENALPAGLILDTQSGIEMVTSTRKEVIRIAGSAFEIEIFHVLIRKGEDLDFTHIEHWCGIHGTLELLEQARSVAGG